MSDSKHTILGLDLGTTSIGWCLIEADPLPKKIIKMGVRIFPEGVDRTKGEKSLNQDRREARSLRRQGCRRYRRKLKLLHALQDAKLLPKDTNKLQELFQLNPYELRAKALNQKLEPYELGRAIYQLGQRRGFKSNRKTGTNKEDGAVAQSISAIDKAMNAGNFLTLGQYLNSLDQKQLRIRGQYTARSMYEHEFEQIWQTQEKHHSKTLDVANKKRIRDAIFEQRALKIQKHLIGGCDFEIGHKRVATAMPVAQEFRLWQNLNNLKAIFNDGTERWFTDKERLKLAERLAFKKQLSWEQIRKALDFPDRSSHFNLERVRKTGLLGNQTADAIAKAIHAGTKGQKAWQALGSRKQEQLTSDLLNIADDITLRGRLRKYWRFDETAVEKLMTLQLPKGYLHVSQKAARKILGYMKSVSTTDNKGLTYNLACEAAGYLHTKPDTERCDTNLLFPGKPAFNKTGENVNHNEALLTEPMVINELRNPMVERALYQVRRVVNAIIKEYGKPKIIRIEMARDMKASRKQREETDKRNKKFEALNKDAIKALQEINIKNPSRTDIIKYRLWQECKHECPYTGKTISMDALFGDNPQFEIEHIIPYSRCLNDSYMNKTLCYSEENAAKGKLTPAEFYSGNEEKYKEVLQRAGKLPHAKFKRFALDAVDDTTDFVSQQLNETRYISRQAVSFLKQLGVTVEPVKGGTTALLRRAWHLNNILSINGEKNRLDHRHHAIDALVVSLTTRSAVRALSTGYLQQGRLRIEIKKEPIPDIREKATEAANNIIVSHKTNRKIAGALHKEFLYGMTGETDDKGVPEVVIRKSVAELSKEKDLEHIRDPRIRKLAIEHLRHSKDFKDAFKNHDNPFGMVTKKGAFQPIKKVRMTYHRSVKQIGDGRNNKNNLRNVWTQSNHHIEIIEYKDKKDNTKWRGMVVSMLEAATRKRLNKHVIEKNHNSDEKLIAAIHKEDMVQLDHKGENLICRVQKFDQSGKIELRVHTDASQDLNKFIRKTPGSLLDSNAKKITIDLLGNILPGYD